MKKTKLPKFGTGDFEVWLSNKMQVRYTEREAFFLHFRKKDSHYVLVKLRKKDSFDLSKGN
ncbi:hypothetical protein QLS71_009425 [Mariniflexile litorale]|uniref:Uncharacterized protein n=1 Tax=Mariniflexile litorale TaxID=3045158 RepID=A0AAU7EAB6_9FLAO|nr:hypothetical protein [Mariniflexile sp. KMM 9835]MDQ8210565.1 hypothetical protein [Mariniflexile sp. KMM 9835]